MNGLIRKVEMWDAEARCQKGHLHFASSQHGAEHVTEVVKTAIQECDQKDAK